MIKISKKVEYALMSLKVMANKKKGQLTTAREIGEMFNAPVDTIAKVMQALNNNKILNSIKGVKGGYLLTTKLETISYLQLVKIVEGKSLIIECEAHRPCAMREHCNIKKPIKILAERMSDSLDKITIKDLLF